MNLLYAFNDKFVPQVAASICSVCENNKSKKLTFYLISDGISKDHQKQLKDFITAYHQKLQIIEIDNLAQYFGFEFDPGGWSPVALARLVLDKLLPNNLDRLLYLDSDIIVRGDLTELYTTDLGGAVLAAGIEPTVDRAWRKRLGIGGLYYNSGVLVIDWQRWHVYLSA